MLCKDLEVASIPALGIPNHTLKTIIVFLSVFLVVVISETLLRYVGDSFIYLFFLTSMPIIFYIVGYTFLIKKVRYG